MSTPTIDVPETTAAPVVATERRDGPLRRVLGSQLVWPALSLAVLLVVTGLLSDNFFTIRLQDGNLYGALPDIVRNGSPVLMVAIGLTLVIATRGIDLSVGAIAAISASIAAVQIVGSADEGAASAAVLGMAMALGVAVLLGLWNGFLVSVLGIQPIIATLVLLVAGRGLAMLVSDGQITTVNNETFSGINGYVLSLPVAFVIAFGLYVATTLLVRRTALGMLIEAVGINPEASRLAGVRSRTIIWTVYVFSGLCAGVAGLVIAANTNSVNANNLGLWIELDAILAVVIGGTSLAGGRFSLTGTLLGALLIATLSRTIPAIGIPSEANYLVKALVVIAVCLLQSPRARAALRVRRQVPVAPAAPATPATPAAPVSQKGAVR